METTPPVNTVNLDGLLSETKRILKPHSTHFFALSIFFLPLAFTLVITPTFHLHLTGDFFTGDLFLKVLTNHQKVVILHLLYFLIVYFFTLCAIGTISYSTYNASIGNPVNYLTTLKSLTFTFFPLVSITIVANLILFAVSLAFFMFVVKILTFLKTLGISAIDYTSIYFIAVATSMCIATIVYLQMNWCLAPMVVVAESKFGPAALMRSWDLTKGMRSISSSLFLYYLFVIGSFELLTLISLNFRDNALIVVLVVTMLGSFLLMMGLLSNTAANTMLYMYCKDFHGELVHEIADGFDYINLNLNLNLNLPLDDEKVAHVVTVVEAQ